MIVRVRSKDGNFRFQLEPSDDISQLVTKVLETAENPDPSTLTISNQPRGNEILVSSLQGRSLGTLGVKHGDLIFVSYKPNAGPSESASPANETVVSSTATSDYTKRPWESAVEDSVDTYWRRQDGKIPRSRDSRFCKHGPNAMCDYCMPLEPYDPAYHAEHSIKHLSYHAYLRKLTPKGPSATASSTSSLPPLSPLSYKVKIPCPTGGHPDWPAGICTACQPSAITLQSQPFRMVDHLEIASMDIIDRFLHAWRQTGNQRFGWLIGRYEPYEEVPMGVKAVVEAIHEPPQEGEVDGLSLGSWEDEPRIRALAKGAVTPLTIVGYIFTDLTPSPEDRTKTLYKRHPQSFYLSSLEAIFAAQTQLANPTSSKSSPTGLFSSRMVTAVLTGTEDGAIDVSAYQVSEQAAAMVEADMVEASVDPGIVRVKEEDSVEDEARYVPDVFFRYKNEYGLEVKKSAKPCFPVEYLMVNVSHGFPQNPSPMFHSVKFSIENRRGLEEQNINKVMSELARVQAPDLLPGSQDGKKRADLLDFLSDWHLVSFMGTTDLISPKDMQTLLRVASSPNRDDPSILDSLLHSESWHTLMTFARETTSARKPASTLGSEPTIKDQDIPQDLLDQFAQEDGTGGAGGSSAAGNIRICPYCTFENTHGGTDCEVCGLPLA